MKGTIQVAVLMGSESDRDAMQACIEQLEPLTTARQFRDGEKGNE